MIVLCTKTHSSIMLLYRLNITRPLLPITLIVSHVYDIFAT